MTIAAPDALYNDTLWQLFKFDSIFVLLYCIYNISQSDERI